MTVGEMKTIRANVKDIEATEDTTKLLVKVTSFGSPENKDLGGDYFQRDCDFGDNRVKTVKAFYDHAMNDQSNPYAKTQDQLIGTATLKTTDDEGRWFLFEIEKSNAYHDGILALNEMKILGASTQAYFGGVDRAEDGGLKRWWESEVTLTVTPMDTKTIGETFLALEEEDNDSLKSLIEDWKNLLEQEKKSEGDEPDDTSPEKVDSVDATELDMDIDDEVAKILSEDLDEQLGRKFVSQEDFSKLMDEFQKLSGSISAYVNIWGNLDEGEDVAALLTRISANQELSTKAIIATQKALKNLAKHTADTVTNEMNKTLKSRSEMSEVELDAERLLEEDDTSRKSSTLSIQFPSHAPGGN